MGTKKLVNDAKDSSHLAFMDMQDINTRIEALRLLKPRKAERQGAIDGLYVDIGLPR